jgi:transposase
VGLFIAMTNHCAVACPIVTEAVKAATPQSRIEMALAAIESEKISVSAAAERFRVSRATLQRQAATCSNGQVADKPEQATIGKDGKMRKPPAAPAEITKAWSMKDSGMSTPAIAKDLGRGERTVREWLGKERPVAPPPKEKSEPLKLTPPVAEAKPQKPDIPANLKQAHRREQRRIKERWQPIAEHLRAAHDLIRAEKDRLCKEYAGPQGRVIMQRRWQQMAEIWGESGLLNQFPEITGEPESITLNGLLSELERASRMSSNWIGCIAAYTGCRPDPTQHQPAAGPNP